METTKTHTNSPNGFQRLKIAPSLFSKLRTGFTGSRQSIAQNQVNIQHWSIYRRCSEVTLEVWLDCVLRKEFRKLVKSGNPPDYHIVQAWEELHQDWCNLTGNAQTKSLLNLKTDLEATRRKYDFIEICLHVLAIRYSKDLVCELHKMGYPYEFDWNDQEKYKADLERLYGNWKSVELSLQIKQATYEKEIGEMKSGAATEKDWDDMIAAITIHCGFHIDRKTTTLSEFASYKRDFERKNEAEKRAAENIRKGHKNG